MLTQPKLQMVQQNFWEETVTCTCACACACASVCVFVFVFVIVCAVCALCVWEGEEGKEWWWWCVGGWVGGWVLCLFVVSLTCKSFVRLGERCESHC